MSFKVALEELGFGPCYHMREVFEHPEHIELWGLPCKGSRWIGNKSRRLPAMWTGQDARSSTSCWRGTPMQKLSLRSAIPRDGIRAPTTRSIGFQGIFITDLPGRLGQVQGQAS